MQPMQGRRIILPALFLLGGLCSPGDAQSVPVNLYIIVANQIVHPVRVDAGGISRRDRVDLINERINTIIAREPLAPSNIRLRTLGGDPAIFVGRYLVTTVTRADARANRMTQQQLAQRWLREYQRALPQARPDQNWGVEE